jgi:uncharacterized Zn finger protein
MNRPVVFAGTCSMVGMPVSLPFTEADIRLAAGDKSFERGLEYLDAVEDLEISDTEVTANVYGSSEYTVCLMIGDQRLSGGCTCPYGDEALRWAERGLREAAHPDQQLVDYLARRYAGAGRQADVLGLRRDRFLAERTLTNYQALREAATASGIWPAERENALVLLSEDKRVWRRQPAWAWTGPVLIDALIDDRDLDAAWAAAKDAASERQWLRLADASTDSHPADALAVYRTTIESLKVHTGDDNYRRIASLLLSARACHLALGTPGEFTRYVAALRVEQKRKRNLMKILNQNGL